MTILRTMFFKSWVVIKSHLFSLQNLGVYFSIATSDLLAQLRKINYSTRYLISLPIFSQSSPFTLFVSWMQCTLSLRLRATCSQEQQNSSSTRHSKISNRCSVLLKCGDCEDHSILHDTNHFLPHQTIQEALIFCMEVSALLSFYTNLICFFLNISPICTSRSNGHIT